VAKVTDVECGSELSLNAVSSQQMTTEGANVVLAVLVVTVVI